MMQSIHYNNGSVKLTRERSTMISRWEADEVARWISGLAGIEREICDIFLKNNINGVALALLLREDLQRMGIIKLDQQLILMQSIDLLLSLVDRLNSETLALLFMRIHCASISSLNLLKENSDDKDQLKDNSNTIMKSPEFYASISHLSDTIVAACHWLGRLPFIENVEYIDLRRKIIKVLVQIRFLLRNLRVNDQINMAKSKLILEIKELRTTTITLIHQNKDSLFSSDRYLIRVHLRRPIKDDVNIEYTTMPDFTHVISSIETEAMGYMASGFNAINIGDEIIEINNQVVIGWDPVHFTELLRASSQSNEICLLVKKMPRHKDDEVYTKGLTDGPYNTRRSRARGALERKQQQTRDNRTRLLEQEGEIEIESDDEALYQSKRSSLKKPDQHSSLPDLTEAVPPSPSTYTDSQTSDPLESFPSSSTPATPSTSDIPLSPNSAEVKPNYIERSTSALSSYSSPAMTPKSPKKTGLESYIPMLFRSRPDTKSIIPDHDDSSTRDQPQLVHVKRINSIHKHDSSSNLSTTPTDDRMSTSPTTGKSTSLNKSTSQTSLQTNTSSTLSSISNLFKSFEAAEKNRQKRSQTHQRKNSGHTNDNKSEFDSPYNSCQTLVTNKPPLNHQDTRDSQSSLQRRRREKRTPSYRRISCKDLGKGDCEGFLYRYSSRGALSIASWKLYWCVLKGGILYIFKSQDDVNQEVSLKLEGKNISPAPEKKKYAFRIVDEINQTREYFSCSTRDEMAKWMNKMGLAAINFNIDDSKIAGFHKGFLDSREASPVSTPRMMMNASFISAQSGHTQNSSAGNSDNESDKESIASWQQSISQHSSITDVDLIREKRLNVPDQRSDVSRHTRSSSSTSILSLPETKTTTQSPTPFGQKLTSMSKGHHRTCSSPIRFPSNFIEERENVYVQSAARCEDSDSSNDISYQRTFVNSEVLVDDRTDQMSRSPRMYQALMLNSSGGFTTPTAPLSSTSSDRTASFSPSPVISSHQRPSNSSVFLADDDEIFSSSSSRSDQWISSSHIPTSERFQSNSSSSSSQQHSPAFIPRSTPMKTPKSGDDTHHRFHFFHSRSPSSSEKKVPSSMETIKHLITSSMQRPPLNNVEQNDDDDDDLSPPSSVF